MRHPHHKTCAKFGFSLFRFQMVTIGTGTTRTIVAILESSLSESTVTQSINGVSLRTRAGKFKSRYSSAERLQILGATQADLNATIRLFCPGRPLYAATRGKNDDPRDWTTPRGRIPDSQVLRHLTGNLTPGINPKWVAPHSWEATWWIGIDVDFRGDRDDFQRRCKFVVAALATLGIPSKAILRSVTPSGGRHYRFFTTRKVRVTDIPHVLALVGLQESAGQIEVFPKLNKGMRLPFGYISGREHEPRKWLRFIRAYRRRRFPRVNWLKCMQMAEQHAAATLNAGASLPKACEVLDDSRKDQAPRRRVTRVHGLGIPRSRSSSSTVQHEDRYKELLSRPLASPSEATELWELGICAEGTRVESTKRVAWHLLFVRRLPLKEAANKLVEWVYQTGHHTSEDVRKDLTQGTRLVEKWTRGFIEWLDGNPSSTQIIAKDLTHFSLAEVDAIRTSLGAAATDKSLLSAACSFLRFAKLHGAQQPTGWLVQIAVNGVIRKWRCCSGMKYKPLIDALKANGLIELTREKRQTSNGTGRPRTYLIKVRPELRTGAALTQEQALQHAPQPACPSEVEGVPAGSPDESQNTYRMIYHPSSSEKMRKLFEEVEQDRSNDESRSASTSRSMNLFGYRQAEAARLARLSRHDSVSTPTGPLTITGSEVVARRPSGPLVQMVTTVNSPDRGNSPGEWRRRFRQQKASRPDLDATPVLIPSMSSDRSSVVAIGGSHHPQRRHL